MEWMLVFVIVSLTSDRVASPITVPVATEKLCEEAKVKLEEAYKKTQPEHFYVVGECVKVR